MARPIIPKPHRVSVVRSSVIMTSRVPRHGVSAIRSSSLGMVAPRLALRELVREVLSALLEGDTTLERGATNPGNISIFEV